MVGGPGHLGGGDAAGAVQGGKDLGEPDHLAADGGVLFDDRHGESLVGQIQGRLKAGDAAADHQGIESVLGGGCHGWLPFCFSSLAASARKRDASPYEKTHLLRIFYAADLNSGGPSSCTRAFMSLTSLRNARLQTVQMAVSRSRRMSISSAFIIW